jgi:hypothetical protein
MQDKGTTAVREADVVDLQTSPFDQRQGTQHRLVRGQNFLVEWIEAEATSSAFPIESVYETMVLLPDVGADIEGEWQRLAAGARCILVIPAGKFSIQLAGAGTCCVLTSNSQAEITRSAVNAKSYQTADPSVAAIGPGYRRRRDPNAIRVFEVDKVEAPSDNPRLKMFQSETLSINWVEYQGPRDRAALSPHAHKQFEQGSLTISGDFQHHLRVEWGKDANLWRNDVHAAVASPSVTIIPPQVVHTTEGVNGGHHLLIDIFSPPRRDFIARNWVANSSEYTAPALESVT